MIGNDGTDQTPEWLIGAQNEFGDLLNKDTHTDVRISETPDEGVVAVIRTSDRIMFKRCRRRWGWQSHLRHNLGPKIAQSPLWFGSGVHYALEDYHGYNIFGHPTAAFEAYVKATTAHNPNSLPEDWRDLVELGRGMLNYYANIWLVGRDPLQTYWLDGKPQVEVNFKIPVPFDARKWGIDKVVYSGQLDRVVIDEHQRLWIVEYKTAKFIQTLHFQTDPQISTYMWAGDQIYDLPLAGVIYQQHLKDIPEPPTPLKNGGISVNKQQRTSHKLYRQALIQAYGAVEKSPPLNVDFLNALAAKESEYYDPFVHRQQVYRNEQTGVSESQYILMECEDMLNPVLPLYPNPTRECQHMCTFNGACASMNDGSDWMAELNLGFQPRDTNYDSWRKYLVYPEGAKVEREDFSQYLEETMDTFED